MFKRVAIVQSNYIPWKGYFDLINSVDEFILFDDMQYTRRDWRNRNRIKTAAGPLWLTIPVQVKGKYLQTIKETEISDPSWPELHLKTLCTHYARARHFPANRAWLTEVYEGATSRRLSEINHHFLVAICARLGIRTRISWSMDYQMAEGKTERLVELCRQAGGSHYLSGPAARDYIDADLFARAGIDLAFYDYSDYPEYGQLHPPFEHGVSVLDLILNEGPAAPLYLKSFRQAPVANMGA
jgi:WbqC-like protein family